MMRFLFLLALLPAAVLSTAVNSESPSFCESPTVVSQSYIGEDKDVKVENIRCANDLTARSDVDKRGRSVNVCGTHCNTRCFKPAGGGPNPFDCKVIANLLNKNRKNDNVFTIPAGEGLIKMAYRSCTTYFANQAGVDEQYCLSDWAGHVDSLAFNCQAQQNAHGGKCVADDQRWYIQVQTS
ncbi:unnamed protein product [Somion occarium]|uniref:Uncharacterized protein n=1 Tax=Somion occarium TaxID=3059160 RepID=A0ABP1CSS5_9APHY